MNKLSTLHHVVTNTSSIRQQSVVDTVEIGSDFYFQVSQDNAGNHSK